MNKLSWNNARQCQQEPDWDWALSGHQNSVAGEAHLKKSVESTFWLFFSPLFYTVLWRLPVKMKTYDTHYFLSAVFRLRRLKRSCLNLTWFLKEDWAFPSIPSSLTLTESQLLRLTWSAAGIVNNNLSPSPVVFPFFWQYHQTNRTTRLLQNRFFD